MSTSNPRDAQRDLNRDPITGAPGSHPVGVGVGGTAGGVAGALAGAVFGPIGALVGATIGTIAGASAGKGVAEQVDPTGEREYWRSQYSDRPYASAAYDYENDLAPAYDYGTQAREQHTGRAWDETLAADLERNWAERRGSSQLDWAAAQPAVRDAWDRIDRTYQVYNAIDSQYRESYNQQPYYDPAYAYEDYRQAYRYGTFARANNPDRAWNEEYEAELASGWDSARGQSKLGWTQARAAARDAFESDRSNNQRRDV